MSRRQLLHAALTLCVTTVAGLVGAWLGVQFVVHQLAAWAP